MPKTYSKPDLRISPIWRNESDGTIWQVREDGQVTIVALKDERVQRETGWVIPSDKYTPLLPPGEQPPLVIEPGKYYRMKNGRKAFVAGRNPFRQDYPWLGCIDDDVTCQTWCEDGSFSPARNSDFDLIAEWEEQ